VKQILIESAAVARTTLAAPVVLLLWPFVWLSNLWRTRLLRRVSLITQFALGQRLYDIRLGDDKLRGQVGALNERIVGSEVTRGPTQKLKAERRDLLMRLAAPFLAQEKPPPGVEAEHRKARAAQVALLTAQENRAAHASQKPPRGIQWRRLGIGYAVLGCVALVAALLVWPGFLLESESSEPSTLAGGGDAPPPGEPKPGDQRKELNTREQNKPDRNKGKSNQHPGLAPDKLTQAMASVAYVRGWQENGSGFLIRPKVLVTTAYVVRNTPMDQVKVYFPSAGPAGKMPVTPTLLTYDRKRDLAFLVVETDAPPLSLPEAHSFQRGEQVTVLGNPGEEKKGLRENEATSGELAGQFLELDLEELRTSLKAANAGGPVLDATGRIIGMITLRAVRPGRAYSVPRKDLHEALTTVDSLEAESIARTNSLHNLEVLFRRVAKAGSHYAREMAASGQVVSNALRDGKAPGTVLAAKRGDKQKELAVLHRDLVESVKTLPASVRDDTRIPKKDRDNIAFLWALYGLMKKYVDNPGLSNRQEILTFLAKSHELPDLFHAQVKRLRRDLGVDNLEQ
jgi:S1-C subfamily serine protease